MSNVRTVATAEECAESFHAAVDYVARERRYIVGWCDIIRNPVEGFRHVGRLGMGLLPKCRRRGQGRKLATTAIRAAGSLGIERVELEVFATNAAAIALYRTLGFATEGVKRGSWRCGRRV